MFISVDLPLPDGPMMARYSLLWTWRATPRRACTVSSPMWYNLVTPRISMTSGPIGRTVRRVARAGAEEEIMAAGVRTERFSRWSQGSNGRADLVLLVLLRFFDRSEEHTSEL